MFKEISYINGKFVKITKHLESLILIKLTGEQMRNRIRAIQTLPDSDLNNDHRNNLCPP